MALRRKVFLSFVGLLLLTLVILASLTSISGNDADTIIVPARTIKNRPSQTIGSVHLATTTHSALPQTTTPHSIIWGAYVGDRVEDGDAFEALVGKRMVTRATFVHWGNENAFPADIGADVKAKGQVLTIFWEAMDYNGDPTAQPRFSYAAILRGDWDAYMQSFALDAKKYGGPIILIPFEEMNGDWYPWSGTENGNTAEEETRAYQHIHDMFTLVPNVKFGWDVNSDSVPDSAGNTLEDYYPGSAYVDYVGVDGFNDANPWMSFNDIFASTLSRLSVYRKPLFIFSFASAEGRAKPTWIESAMQSIKDTPLITGWIWFNENKEKNWLVNSDAASLQAFKNALP